MQNDELVLAVRQLKRRVQNLELFALALLIGIGIYVTRSAEAWFDGSSTAILMFGVAFTFCLLLLFLRYHIADALGQLGMNKRLANLLFGAASVVGMSYLVPAVMSLLR